MATDWLGSIVSINCGESLGVYQGRVSAVDQVSQTISLTRPFHNGVKCLVPEVTFRLVAVFSPPAFSHVGGGWDGFGLVFLRNELFALNLPIAAEHHYCPDTMKCNYQIQLHPFCSCSMLCAAETGGSFEPRS